MIFCDSASDTVASSPAAGAAPSAVAFSAAGGSTTGSGFGGAAVASNDARIREIGGRTVLFFFNSPSPDFLRGFFSSINETLSTSRRGAGFGETLVVGSGACAGLAGNSTFAFFSTLALAGDLGGATALTGLE